MIPGWNIGSLGMILLAYLIRDWVYMQLSFAAFASLLVLFYFLVIKVCRLLNYDWKWGKIMSLFRFQNLQGGCC